MAISVLYKVSVFHIPDIFINMPYAYQYLKSAMMFISKVSIHAGWYTIIQKLIFIVKQESM